MRVSVVITNHDYERFLAEAIDSALGQTHPDTEVVVVDDGSTDGSREVIAAYGDRVVAVLRPHGGQAAAVNAGFAACTGDAVVFLDPDDVLLPEAAATVASVLAEPGVAKAHWPMLVADAHARPTGALEPAQPLDEGDLRERLWTCPRYTTPPMSGNAYARWCLEEVLPMPEAPFPAGADCYLYHLVIPFGEVRTAPAPLSVYRRHAGSTSAQPPLDRIARWARLDDAAWASLAAACAARGLPAPVERWRRASFNHRLAGAVEDLRRHVPPGARFLLLDDSGTLGLGDDGALRPVPWWGTPGDAGVACAELERHRADGVRYAVVAWPAFWWLAYFRGLQEHLRDCARLVAATDRVRVYDLEAAPRPRPVAPGGDRVAVVTSAGGDGDALVLSLSVLAEQDGHAVAAHVCCASPAARAAAAAAARAAGLPVHLHDGGAPHDRLRVAAGLADPAGPVVLLGEGVVLGPTALSTLLAEHRPRTVVSTDARRVVHDGAGPSVREAAPGERADLCRTELLACDPALLDADLLGQAAGVAPDEVDVVLSSVAAARGARLARSEAAVHRDAAARALGRAERAAARRLGGPGPAAPPPRMRRPRTDARRVAVFREAFLPVSETFVRDHLVGLRRWDAQAVTTRRVPGGLDVPGVPLVDVAPAGDRGDALARALDASGAALVHAHFGPDAALVREPARRVGLPLVATFHGYDATIDWADLRRWPSGALLAETWDELMEDVARIVTVSGHLRERLVARGADPARITVIPCGVDVERFAWTPPPAEGGIAFVGRLVEKKGCADLLEAVARLGERPRLRIAGDGPLRPDLEHHAARLGVRAEFLGALGADAVRDVLAGASVVAMPSRQAANGDCEGLPVVSLEAAALGRPVVGYRHSGLVESVVCGRTGVLVAEGDVPALAGALEQVLGDAAAGERMGRAARRHVAAHFDQRACLARLEQLYDDVAGRPRGGADP